jgi:hypothetical protein
MASTYSTSLRLELIGTGEQSGVWGNTTNNNLGTLLEQAITGVDSITLSSSTYTLTNLNGDSDEARNAVLVFTGSLSGNCTVTAPSVNKVYLVRNATTGGHNVVMSAGGITVAVPAGLTYLIYSDGTDFFIANNYDSTNVNITGGTINGTTIGLTTPAAAEFTALEATSFSVPTITSNVIFSSTGSITLPVGSTIDQPISPAEGMVRFNTTTNKFEGYDGTTWGPLGGGNKTDTGLWQNAYIIVDNQIIETGYNASSVGPITIDSGVSVTVPDGSNWLIL